MAFSSFSPTSPQLADYRHQREQAYQKQRREEAAPLVHDLEESVTQWHDKLKSFKVNFYASYHTMLVEHVEALQKDLLSIHKQLQMLSDNNDFSKVNLLDQVMACHALLDDLLSNQSQGSQECYKTYVLPLSDKWWNLKSAIERAVYRFEHPELKGYKDLDSIETQPTPEDVETTIIYDMPPDIFSLLAERLDVGTIVNWSRTNTKMFQAFKHLFETKYKSGDPFIVMQQVVGYFEQRDRMTEFLQLVDKAFDVKEKEFSNKTIKPATIPRVVLVMMMLGMIGFAGSMFFKEGSGISQQMQWYGEAIGVARKRLSDYSTECYWRHDLPDLMQRCGNVKIGPELTCRAFFAFCNQLLCKSVMQECDDSISWFSPLMISSFIALAAVVFAFFCMFIVLSSQLNRFDKYNTLIRILDLELPDELKKLMLDSNLVLDQAKVIQLTFLLEEIIRGIDSQLMKWNLPWDASAPRQPFHPPKLLSHSMFKDSKRAPKPVSKALVVPMPSEETPLLSVNSQRGHA